MARTTIDDEPQALMALVSAGDRHAFRQLAVRLHGPALRLATRVLSDRAEAEDAVQVALTKLWSNADRFDGVKGSVEGWFRRLLVNACIDRKRSLKVVAPIEAAANVSSSEPTPHEAAEGSERDRTVGAAVERLVPRQRAAIALFYGEGASMAEIAAILETSPKAVEGLLGRARQELAGMLSAMRNG